MKYIVPLLSVELNILLGGMNNNCLQLFILLLTTWTLGQADDPKLTLVTGLPSEAVFGPPHTLLPSRTKRSSTKTPRGSANLRIKIFYDDSLNDLPSKKRALLQKTVLPSAVSHWEKALRVSRPSEAILLNRKCKNNQYFISQEQDEDDQYCKEACVTTKCGEFLVPQEHLAGCRTCNAVGRNCRNESLPGVGVEGADFILYVSSIESPQCQAIIGSEAQTVAYAAHCQQESSYDRPVAGHTNICPGLIREEVKEEVQGLIHTIKHELLHALGFSSSLYAFWRKPDGRPRTPRNADGKPPIDSSRSYRQWNENTIQTVTRDWVVRSGKKSRKFTLLVTPRVVEEARNHFGCSDLIGVELEDQGGTGTALNHWEKRILHNEAMTGTVHTENPLYSRISFALMEDTGWYLPVYELADDLPWGKNFGCDFLTQSCLELLQKPGNPFCSLLPAKDSLTDCSFDRSAVGNCNLLLYEDPLPEIYQNFKSLEGVKQRDLSRVGSSVALADYCPYVQEFNWSLGGGKASRGTICKDPANQPTNNLNFALETYGKNSICLRQSRVWVQESLFQSRMLRRYGSGCYETSCEKGSLFVHLGDDFSFECESLGEIRNISLRRSGLTYTGGLVCPSCEGVCGPEACGN